MISAVVCLAMAVYYEARSEPLAGQLAVAAVILNRGDDDRHPDNVCEVVTEGPTHASGHPIRHRCQFSFWCDGKPERPRHKQAWKTAKVVAEIMLYQPIDLSEGATFYHTVDVSPRWRFSMDQTVVIGRHRFYRR